MAGIVTCRLRVLMVGVGLLLSGAGLAPPGIAAKEEGRFFSETGQTVRGAFLTYWAQHGQLNQVGYPLSGEVQERSDTDGKVYTMQYFEFAVLEQHPENAPPYDVLPSLLGSFAYAQRYPQGAAGQAANTASHSRLYALTGMRLGGEFRDFWDSFSWGPEGGVAQFGYPISNEFLEVTAADGLRHQVQYFQRLVLERQRDQSIRARPLGLARYQARYGATMPPVVVTRATCPATDPGPSHSDRIDPAPVRASVGTGHLLTGLVRSSQNCAPIPHAQIIFWLAGPDGQYDDAHTATVFTDAGGAYRFESNFPAFYGAGGPHIHLYASAPGFLHVESEYFVYDGETAGIFNLALRPDHS